MADTLSVRIDGKFYPGTLPQELARFVLWCRDNEISVDNQPWAAVKGHLDSLSSWTDPKDIPKGVSGISVVDPIGIR